MMPTQEPIIERGTAARIIAAALLASLMSGCAVVAVTDAAVSVAATVVKVGADAVGVAADVVRAGVRAVTPDDKQKQ